MECPLGKTKQPEWLISYAARTLAPDAEQAFERHMESCGECREGARVQRDLWLALDQWTPAEISADFDERLYRRIAEDERAAWWRRLLQPNWSWRPAMPVAAACAALVAVFLMNSPRATAPPVAPSQPKLQIEQVESALDDMEMLRVLMVEAPQEAPPPGGEM